MGEKRRGSERHDKRGNAYFKDLTYFQETIYLENAPYITSSYTGSKYLALNNDNKVFAVPAPWVLDTGSFLTSGSIDNTTLYLYSANVTYSLNLPVGSGSSSSEFDGNVTASADTGSYILDLSTEALSIQGGKNIHTFASTSKDLYVILDHHIEVHSVAVTQSASNANIISTRGLDHREPFKVNNQGIVIIGPTSSLPSTVITGSIVYVSGSSERDNFYVGLG